MLAKPHEGAKPSTTSTAQPASDPASPTSATRLLAIECLAGLDALTDDLVGAVHAGDRPWAAAYDAVSVDDLRWGCGAYLRRVLERVAGEVSDLPDDEVAVGIGRARAEQGVPLEVMLRTFRLGGRVVWEGLLREARRTGASLEVIGPAATVLWSIVDGMSSSLSTAYRQMQGDQVRRAGRRRHAVFEDLLAGRADDAAFLQRAAGELNLPIGGRYLVVVAALSGQRSPAGRAQMVLDAHRIRSIWHERADTVVGVVPLPETSSFSSLPSDAGAALGGRAGAAHVDGGLAAVALGHRLATLALSTVPINASGIASIDERVPESLLVRSPELCRRLVDTRLGPVLALPDKEAKPLLDTLTAWLEADRSASVAAERLICHRNTVLNRLHRVAVLTGQSLDGRRTFVELSLALSALELSEPPAS
ncbi:helix-turn-helix domain-containing protein [Frankia sp. Mgl5]|uniref:PucR family transcriptional regulator n=1 Tax=Frankia sp. Mgl5 TaxID=2933793 RepID=UPI00200BDA9E|nr:helix-turn-helix domain-containing protein [Frankia sp. Mgl5]MCK9929890.1 helix-turn-helix domain-containing protein [Frankia sp. Mgl5]